VNQALFTSSCSDWETPPEVYGPVVSEFGLTLDAAASHLNAILPVYYSATADGLQQAWNVPTWCNPPYGHGAAGHWVEKAAAESRAHRVPVVMLLPARTDTRWWHRVVIPNYREIRFFAGRVQFRIGGEPIRDKHGRAVGAPFPSVLVVFYPRRFLWRRRIVSVKAPRTTMEDTE